MKEFDIVDQFDTEKREYDRSLFLTIICVLSFIGSWVTVLFYALYINKVSAIERSVYLLDEVGMVEYKLMKISIITALVSFTGALIMWRMRKIGLFIYAIGQLVPAAMMSYITIVLKPIESPDSYIMLAFAGIQVIFIGLYMFSWKYMRW